MQKTVREWLEELPEPYRSQALENIANPDCQPDPDFKCEQDTSVSAAFVWGRTPQGHHYWGKASEHFQYGGDMPTPIPPTPTERQTAEALLKEFGEWWNAGNKEPQDTVITEGAVNDFLTSKYGKG